jgi:mannose-6-phosphate isomerase-like protein (cupin superfamily)
MISAYTLRNLRDDVEDMAPKFGMAPDVEAHFASRDLELSKCGVSLQRLAPDATMPFGHHHAVQEELYVIVAGAGRVKLDDDVLELRTWDAVRVSPTTTRAFSAGPDGLEFLAYGAPKVDEPDAEAQMTPGWWDGAA